MELSDRGAELDFILADIWAAKLQEKLADTPFLTDEPTGVGTARAPDRKKEEKEEKLESDDEEDLRELRLP